MSLEGLATGVAGIEIVPVGHVFFWRVPAEEDYASLAFVGKVEQAHVQVLEYDAELSDSLYCQVEVVRLRAVL